MKQAGSDGGMSHWLWSAADAVGKKAADAADVQKFKRSTVAEQIKKNKTPRVMVIPHLQMALTV